MAVDTAAVLLRVIPLRRGDEQPSCLRAVPLWWCGAVAVRLLAVLLWWWGAVAVPLRAVPLRWCDAAAVRLRGDVVAVQPYVVVGQRLIRFLCSRSSVAQPPSLSRSAAASPASFFSAFFFPRHFLFVALLPHGHSGRLGLPSSLLQHCSSFIFHLFFFYPLSIFFLDFCLCLLHHCFFHLLLFTFLFYFYPLILPWPCLLPFLLPSSSLHFLSSIFASLNFFCSISSSSISILCLQSTIFLGHIQVRQYVPTC